MDQHHPAFMIAEVEILDEAYYLREYIGKVGPILAKYNAEIIARGEPIILEGKDSFPQLVILKFENKKSAENFYNSEEYKIVAEHRSRSARVRLRLIDGADVLA